jgi:hypothetical protein
MKMLESKVGLRADRVLAMTAAAAAAATGAGLVGDASMASADLVDSGVVNIAIPNDIQGVYMNLVTGVTGIFDTDVAGWDINPYTAGSSPNGFHLWSATTSTWFASSGVVGGPYPTALGTLVGPGGAFFRPGGGTNVGAQVTLNSANYFGLQFANEGTGANNFGWMEITFGATASERAITRYVYDNSGAAITIGAVPEPTSLSVLALGALGLVARRRRRAM